MRATCPCIVVTKLQADRHRCDASWTTPSEGLPASAWRTITWREGTAGPLSSRVAAVRVRPAHDDFRLSGPRAEEWFLAEWPEGEDEPTKYWLSTLPEAAALEELVAHAKLRWRIERDFEELKQELGLGHFEGRGWRGFHHHASSCVAAYAFLAAGRCRFSPRAGDPGSTRPCARPATGPGAQVVRPERHSPASIATLRRHLGVALTR